MSAFERYLEQTPHDDLRDLITEFKAIECLRRVARLATEDLELEARQRRIAAKIEAAMRPFE